MSCIVIIYNFSRHICVHALVNEVIERQSVCVNLQLFTLPTWLGIACTFSSRTSILAAANPEGGTYNRSKTVLENVKKLSAGKRFRFQCMG
jgi:DNA replicative helicase MCM subunit Mcm2 (Cdc46/Mcm family)